VGSLPHRLTAQDARQSLMDHAAARGREICTRYGPRIEWPQLLELLQDRRCVRYPCEIVFGASGLQPGELARPVAKGERPEDGFRLVLHPRFATRLDRAIGFVLYQLVAVNYGGVASAKEAEVFGASALGLSVEAFYASLCQTADEFVAWA
jgi:hypothetical protein